MCNNNCSAYFQFLCYKNNEIVTNKHSPALIAVAILIFTHDALRVQAYNELFLML